MNLRYKSKKMKCTSLKIFTIALLFVLSVGHAQQKITIPFNPGAWEHDKEQVEFLTYKNRSAVRGKGESDVNILLKDTEFTTGTIEYDVEFKGNGFPGIGFRSSDDRKNTELFYIRYFGTVNPLSRYTLQYAAVMDGINLWDITDEYQSASEIYDGQWNHVKLVISENQMKVYVNDMEKCALHVPILEGSRKKGKIYLTGDVIYSNLTISPGAIEELPNIAGFNLKSNDTRFLRNWKISNPADLPFERDVIKRIPNTPFITMDSTLMDNSSWKPIHAKYRGMVNITEKLGATEQGKRRVTWLKTTITSDTDQIRKLKLGFSDEIWVFINGRHLYTDKNYYTTPGVKQPRGRATVDNAEINLPLKKGENEIVVGVANYFFAWGLTAKLDATDNLMIE